jgi:hypothetical protein
MNDPKVFAGTAGRKGDPAVGAGKPGVASVQLSKPSRQYVIDLRRDLETLYKDDDDQIKRMRSVRKLENKVALDNKYKLVNIEVKDPTIADECQRVAATLSVNLPKMWVNAGLGDEQTKNATLRKEWTESMLLEAGSREPGVTTFHKLVDAVVADGGGWTKFIYSPDRWEYRYSLNAKAKPYTKYVDAPADFEGEGDVSPDDDEPTSGQEDGTGDGTAVIAKSEKKRKRLRDTDWAKFNKDTEDAKREGGVPFDWLHVDALSVYPVFRGRRIAEVIEVSERPLSSTFRQWRLTKDENGKIRKLADDEEVVADEVGQRQPVGKVKGESVTFIEHWDDTYVTYIVIGGKGKNATADDAVVADQWEHGYNRVPYFWAPGLWHSDWANRKVGWGISQSKMWLVEYRSFLMTVHAQVVARDSFTPLFRKAPAQNAQSAQMLGNTSAPKKDEHWSLATIYEGKPGEELVPIKFPDIARALREEISMVSEAIERLETPRVSGQIGNNLEGAGFAVNQILSEAKLRFDPIAQSIERCLTEITRFAWELVRVKVNESVPVYFAHGSKVGWKTCGPKDLDPGVATGWNLDPERPSAKLIEERYWHERLKAGTAHLDQAISAMGDNPDEVRIGKALDAVRASPLYQQWIMGETFSLAGRGDLLKKQKAAEQMMQTGVVPNPAAQLGGLENAGPAGASPAAMGSQMGAPNMANLAISPHGAGATPVQVGAGPANGAVSGAGPGVVIPTQAAAAGVQRLQG